MKFDSTQNEIKYTNSEFGMHAKWRGKTALIRTLENEVGCSIVEFDRENL